MREDRGGKILRLSILLLLLLQKKIGKVTQSSRRMRREGEEVFNLSIEGGEGHAGERGKCQVWRRTRESGRNEQIEKGD